jgi:DNA topoisomerase I
LFDSTTDEKIVDPRDAAESAGLRYFSDSRPGIHRRRATKGFRYLLPNGRKVSDKSTLRRIRAKVPTTTA